MKSLTKFLLGCALAAGFAATASAQISLYLSPSSQSTSVNGTATYSLNVKGLKTSADYAGPVLGGYNITLDFNSAIASVQSVAFGSLLNLSGTDYQSADTSSAGVLSLMEISFDSASALEAAQPGSFTLATITFVGQASGLTGLTFDLANTSLSDENANTLDLAGGGTGGNLSVVPEPSTTAIALGVVAVGAVLVRRRLRPVAVVNA